MRRLAEALDRLIERPRPVLGVLIVAQIVAAVVFALRTRHNGWLWYQGGDQIWYATTGWFFAHGQLPYALVGYGWALVLTPLMALRGPAFIAALPPTVVLDVVVLGPLATVCVYLLAARLGGRLLGLWSAALWVVAPYAAIPLFVERYHDRYVEQFLPQALGLTEMADFPSMVALLAAAVLIVGSLDRGRYHEAALGGLVAGFAAGIKPSNLLFLAGPPLAYLFARRWREGAAFGLALAPALLALLLWKARAGSISVLSLGETRAAAGSALPVATWYQRWAPFDWHVLKNNMETLREFFWSARLVQFAPFAGAFAVARRSFPTMGLLVGWLGAFVVVKGTSPVATIDSGSFWRLLMPAFPAYFTLAAATPLLVPTLFRRLGARGAPVVARPLARRPVVAAIVALAAVPLLVTAFWRPAFETQKAVILNGILTPVDAKVGLRVDGVGAGKRLTWAPADLRSQVFYRVFRAAGDDVTCVRKRCELQMDLIGTTRSTTFLDHPSAPAGAHYRVGYAANWVDNPAGGDVFELSPQVEAAR